MLKRFIRIIPLFYFSVLVLLLIYHHDLVRYFTRDLDMILKTIFFLPLFTNDNGPAYGFSFMFVSWSLNYEMVFYLIFSISLMFVRFRYHFIYALFFILVFFIPVIFKGYFSIHPEVNYEFHWNYLNFLSNPILLLFLLGVSFGLIIKKIKPSKAIIYIVSSISILLFIAYFINLINSFPGSDIIFCGLLVFSILLWDYNSETIKPPKFIIYLGDISYSIYLIHPLVFIYLSSYVKYKGLTSIESSWYFVCIGVLIVIFISSITYELIEKRFTDFLKSKLLKPVFQRRSDVVQSY